MQMSIRDHKDYTVVKFHQLVEYSYYHYHQPMAKIIKNIQICHETVFNQSQVAKHETSIYDLKFIQFIMAACKSCTSSHN